MKELSAEELAITAGGSSAKELSVEDKIKAIQNTNSYQNMKNAWFPPYHEKEYYFVSYSHQDYKLVYESLHKLQSDKQKLNLWYDHNLTPGRDWEKEARRYIYDFECKGVIFFLSENAVLSQSIHKEIEFVKASGKEYLSINLPCQRIKGLEGEYRSAATMLELLMNQYGDDPAYVGRFSDYDNKLEVLTKTFNDKVIFLRFDEDINMQIDKIITLKRQPLLVIDKGRVTAINNINAEEITVEDFAYIDYEGEREYAHAIDNCAFANCRFLRSVDLEKCGWLGHYSFYNCESLREINLPKLLYNIKNDNFADYTIGNGAFAGCTNLKSITIPGDVSSIGNSTFAKCERLENVEFGVDSLLTAIGGSAFDGCSSLKSLTIPDRVKSIGKRAFEDCENLKSVEFGVDSKLTSIGDYTFRRCSSLESISIPDRVESIGECAFEFCENLESVEFGADSKLVSIGKGAFEECSSLKSITIPDRVESIGSCVFFYCRYLKDINYKGTKQQWKKIIKDLDWDKGTPDYVVHCTDGDLKKGEF